MENINLNWKEQLRNIQKEQLRNVEDDGNGLCRMHQVPLRLKPVGILYGYPGPQVGEIDRKVPNHGLWSGLGGCTIDERNPATEYKAVCWKCTEVAQSLTAYE